MELQIGEELDGSTCVLQLEGELDIHTAPMLKERLVESISRGGVDIVVDLEAVSFIDSSGLGVLVSALRRAKEAGGKVSIVCSRESVLRIFSITGLDKVFPIYSELDEARRA